MVDKFRSNWFNRYRGCDASFIHFTADDRGYSRFNRCRGWVFKTWDDPYSPELPLLTLDH